MLCFPPSPELTAAIEKARDDFNGIANELTTNIIRIYTDKITDISNQDNLLVLKLVEKLVYEINCDSLEYGDAFASFVPQIYNKTTLVSYVNQTLNMYEETGFNEYQGEQIATPFESAADAKFRAGRLAHDDG